MKKKMKAALLWKLIRKVRNWPLFFLNRFGLIKSKTLTFKLRNGLLITSRPFAIDRSALNDVWLEESYEPSNAGIFWDWTACRRIVDVGANIGTFTLYAAMKAPQATIDAVEPEPGNCEILRKNVSQNGFDSRIRVHKLALSDKSGTAELNISSEVSGGHSLFRHGSHGSATLTVPTKPLTDLFAESGILECDFLKMDCEGAEYSILYSLPAAWFKKIRCLAIEYHHFSTDPRYQPGSLKTFLEQNGFRVLPLKKSMWLAIRENV